MIDLDGTENKTKLGANAILGVSMAVLRASANYKNEPVYKYIGNGKTLPRPMMNIINGGQHALNNIDIQEFMIVPKQSTIKERIRCGSEVFHNLQKLLKEAGFSTAVGDEGGFAPNLNTIDEAFNFIVKAIEQAGYIPGKDVCIAIDCAATEFYDGEMYTINKQKITKQQLINYYKELINRT